MTQADENLVFGDFEDLSAEESQRIYHILYGQKNQYANKVEFPWDAGAEEPQGAVGGDMGQSWLCDVNFAGTSAISFMEEGFSITDPSFTQQYDENDGQPDGQYNENDRDSAAPKLQASSKPYERRNKKKRPADYYSRPSEEREEYLDDQSGSTFTMAPEPVQTVPVMQTEYRSQVQVNLLPRQPNKVSDIQTAGNYSDVGNGVNRPVQAEVSSHVTGVHSEVNVHVNSVNNTYMANTIPGASKDYANQSDGELSEVVVDSGVTSTNKILARTETYKVQDHERTSSEKLTNTMDVGCNHVGIPNVQTDATAIPNSVSDISFLSSESDMIVGGVEVSVKDAPALENSSQDNVQYGYTDVPCLDTGSSSEQPEQLTDTASVASMETDGGNSSKAHMDVETSSVTSSVNSVEAASTGSVWGKPKLKTWAALFKGSSTATEMPDSLMGSGENVDRGESAERQEKEYSPLPVPAAEDSNAKQLGEILSKMYISHSSAALQPRGLINRGNWCYINGTLQALVACPPFYNLLKKLPRYPALSRGPSSTPILDALVEFVHEFQVMPRTEKGDRGKKVSSRDMTLGAPFEPSYVYKMLQTIAVNPLFKLGKQEDAEEFLSCILDGMHEEMSAVVTHSRPELEESSVGEEEGYTNGFVHDGEEGDDTEEEDQWEQVGPKKKSVTTRRPKFAKTPIADIFAGMVRSAVYKEKSKETATLEPFFTLQLDIQSDKVWSVKEALEGLVSSEPVSGYTCPKTNAEVEVTKKLSLEELPPVLILHLKFFVYRKDGGSQKLMKRVDYPVELEITKELLSPNARNKLREQQRTYKLFAVVYHHGKAACGGHYTTSVFHPGINGWVHSDDSTVKPTSVSHVLKYHAGRVPYLLYYRRLDNY